ncbi:MAG TPA: DUF892 family protein [Longimicrobiales bacterium]
MDRTSYDAPGRPDPTEQKAIGYASLETETLQRRESAVTERSAREGGRFGDFRSSVADLLSIRSFNDLEERVRANPLRTIALAAGIGFVLQRTHVLDSVVGTLLSGEEEGELSPAEERLLAWLNDAYALEKAQIPILENHAADAERQPHVREKHLEHLERTKHHAKRVKQCIKELGRKPSKAKDAMGRISGAMSSLSTEPFDDEVVRNFLADFAAENLEIASYEAIITAAKDAGHDKIARICEEILEDEEEMVDWLRANLPRAVRDTLDDLNISQSTYA